MVIALKRLRASVSAATAIPYVLPGLRSGLMNLRRGVSRKTIYDLHDLTHPIVKVPKATCTIPKSSSMLTSCIRLFIAARERSWRGRMLTSSYDRTDQIRGSRCSILPVSCHTIGSNDDVAKKLRQTPSRRLPGNNNCFNSV